LVDPEVPKMRKDLMDIIVCPACKSQLKLTIEAETNNDVETGEMQCVKCSFNYPISDGIPNLISPINLA